eukprot:6199360-Pyramimonas_sp.AAC.2
MMVWTWRNANTPQSGSNLNFCANTLSEGCRWNSASMSPRLYSSTCRGSEGGQKGVRRGTEGGHEGVTRGSIGQV